MEYWVLHILSQTSFVSNKHIIRRIMHFLYNNFVLVSNILRCEENFQYPLALLTTHLISGQNPDVVSLVSLALGVGVVLFSLKYMSFQQLTPSSDYYPSCSLCCDLLVLLILHRLISLGGWFLSPPLTCN